MEMVLSFKCADLALIIYHFTVVIFQQVNYVLQACCINSMFVSENDHGKLNIWKQLQKHLRYDIKYILYGAEHKN